MRKALSIALLAAVCGGWAFAAFAATAGRTYYRPGQWVEVPAAGPGPISAPGSTTLVEEDGADTQYALPLSAPWAAVADESPFDARDLARDAWLAAVLDPGARIPGAARDGLRRALPAGSELIPLGDIRRGVPESVDWIICHDFSESKLQPQERTALAEFARRGGGVLFIFTSRAIPAASEELWRDLFGAHGEREKQAPGLPKGLRVPLDFRPRQDIPDAAAGPAPLDWLPPDIPVPPDLKPLLEIPDDEDVATFVWQRCGRGIVLAYQQRRDRGILEGPAESADLFRRMVARLQNNRRGLRLAAVEPRVFRLFKPTEWSAPPRRRLAFLTCGYAVAAIGLLLSFRSFLVRRRGAWLAGAGCIALGGAVVVYALTTGRSGLALETVAILIQEPGADPVEAVFARVERLGPGAGRPLRSASAMPPKLVLDSRYSAVQKSWAAYRFSAGGASVEPLLESGQHTCFASIHPASADVAEEAASAEEVPPPSNAGRVIALFEKQWASPNTTYTYRWVRPAAPPRAFHPSAEEQFIQVRRGPVLVATGVRQPAPAPAPRTVRVAAVQCYSRMGETARNAKRLTDLITRAADRGAKIVVLPECALQGYMDPGRGRVWRTKDQDAGLGPAVEPAAEPVPGKSTRAFGALAKKLGIYLALPMIESGKGKFYNAQVLLDPRGTIIAHHRKTNLWEPGDGTWATQGNEPARVVDTPYGRLGLMICYEVHVLPEPLARAKADIVLYSVGWFGPDTDRWYAETFPRDYVAPHDFAVVVANCSAAVGAPGWDGHGHSCIIGGGGKVLAAAKTTRGSEIIIADLPCGRTGQGGTPLTD